MNKLLPSIVLAFIASLSFAAQATIVQSSTLSANYGNLVNFSTPALAVNTVVTNQFAAQGITFSALGGGALRFSSCGVGSYGGAGFSGGYLNSYGSGCSANTSNDSFSMKFANDVSAASMSFYSSTLSNSVQAFNNNLLVSKFTPTTGGFTYLNASNMIFDELRFVEGGGYSYFILDNVAFVNASAVPEPASLALFGLGLAGLAGLRRQRRK
jgi:hypothetical protein